MRFFNSTLARVGVLSAAVLLTACFHDDDDDVAAIRVVHAVADAPRVNVYLNDDQVLRDFDYREGTGLLSVAAGTYDVRVEAIVPGGNIDVIDAMGVSFANGSQTTIYATGETANSTIAPLLVSDPVPPVAAGAFRATVVHASPVAPEVTVLLCTPGGLLANCVQLGSFEFGETLGPAEAPAGDYVIRVAAGASPGTFTEGDVVFTSATVTLPAGADLQVAAVTSTVNGDSPVSLVVLDGEGSADLFDVSTGALLRAVHASPDAPAVDIVVNDDFAMPAASNLAYTQATDFLGPLAADTYNIKVAAAGTSTAVLDVDAALDSGVSYTAIAYDLLGAPIQAWLLVDDNRRVATEAKLRIVHASPTAGNVDIYLLAPGDQPGDAGVEPSFADVPFGAETGFFGVPGGTYDVYVTPAGDPATQAIVATNVPVDVAGIYTVIARDAVGGGAPLGLILLDDFT